MLYQKRQFILHYKKVKRKSRINKFSIVLFFMCVKKFLNYQRPTQLYRFKQFPFTPLEIPPPFMFTFFFRSPGNYLPFFFYTSQLPVRLVPKHCCKIVKYLQKMYIAMYLRISNPPLFVGKFTVFFDNLRKNVNNFFQGTLSKNSLYCKSKIFFQLFRER